jgi:hypothetical protein
MAILDLLPNLRFILVTFPFHLIVFQLNATLSIEQMVGVSKLFWNTIFCCESKQGGKRQPHMSAFIGNGGPTMRTANFYWQASFLRLVSIPSLIEFTAIEI